MTDRLAAGTALLAGVVAVLLTGIGALPTLLGVGGLLALAGGIRVEGGGVVTVGATVLFGATVLAGVAGVDAGSVVAAGGATVVAWTAGRTSVELRAQLPAADARRLAATHVAGTTLLVAAAAGLALLPRLLRVRASPVGLALVLLGAVSLSAALALE